MDTKTSTQMASIYGLKSSTAFNKLLTQCKVLRHTSKGYILDDSLQGQGYATVINAWFFLPSGVKASKKKAVWTEKGQQFIHNRLARLGILPTDEKRDLFTV